MKKVTTNELYKAFCESFPYISISKKNVSDYIKIFGNNNVDMLKDYILSNELEEDIEL